MKKIKKQASAEIVKPIIKDSHQSLNDNYQALYIDTPFDFTQLANIYSYNGYHTKCINLKATVTASLGFDILPSNNAFSQKQDSNYSFLKDFFSSHLLYAGRTFSETLLALQTDFEIFGNAFLEIIRDKSGIVKELYHLPAKDIVLQYNDDIKKCFAIQNTTSTQSVTFAPYGDYEYANSLNMSEYLHIKNYNPANIFYGIPDYIGSIASILLDRNAAEYNINKFNNNAVPETIVTIVGARFDDNAKTKIGEFFRQNVKGINNAGRSLILEIEDETCKIDVKPIGSEIKDASFRFLRLDVRDEIIAAHGVPKKLLNISEATGWNNSSDTKTQLQIFQELIIKPRQKRLEDLINSFIIKQGMKIDNWELKLNKLYVDDPSSDADYFSKLSNIGVLSTEEIRQELGYDTKPLPL